MRQRKPYKRYSPEFKREAFKRATEEGGGTHIIWTWTNGLK